VWKSSRGKNVNSVKLNKRGGNRSNLWTYAGAKTSNVDELDKLARNRSVKPVALVAHAIRDCSRRGDIVLDSFGGSGTSVIACERTNRKARVIELDPIYCDQIVRRWQRFTARQATNLAKQLYFDEVAPFQPGGDQQ
jgi:DNA modification methylase